MGGDYKRFAANMSLDVLALNPDFEQIATVKNTPEVRAKISSGSQLEAKFLQMWRALDGPVLEREYKFHPRRKWRADFAHPESMVLIEIEGGTWQNGRHNRGDGYKKDCQKYNAATGAGWRVFRYTAEMIQPPQIERLIKFVRDNLA